MWPLISPASGAPVSFILDLIRLWPVFHISGVPPSSATRSNKTWLAFTSATILAIGCMIGIAALLAQAFSHLPMWDEAVDGDLFALIDCVRYARAHLMGAAGIAFGALLLWQL